MEPNINGAQCSKPARRHGQRTQLPRRWLGGSLTGDKLLAETKTLEHGVYSLPYAAGGNAANLEVRAVDEAGNTSALTKIIRNTEESETMNLVAPAADRHCCACGIDQIKVAAVREINKVFKAYAARPSLR